MELGAGLYFLQPVKSFRAVFLIVGGPIYRSRFLTLQLDGFGGAKSADRVSDQEAIARLNRLKDLQWMKRNSGNEKVAFNGNEP